MYSDESKYDLETCHACGNCCYSPSLILTATFSGSVFFLFFFAFLSHLPPTLSLGYCEVTNMNMKYRDIASGKNGMDLMFNLLTSTSSKWIHSPEIRSALKAPLMRLCARYWNTGNKFGK